MLSKSFAALIIFILTSSTNAQAAITPLNSPALELKETPVSGEAQRASIADPCSNVNLAQNLDTSTSVTADETGAILLSPVNFNPGADGSHRSIETVQVDVSGPGKDLVAAQMTPANDDTQQFTIQLPAETKCTGGTNQNLCFASDTMTSGLGNCVVVSQAAGAADAARSPLSTSQANDVRSQRVKRSASADEEGLEPTPAKGDQTGLRRGDTLKRDKRKEKKNKGMSRHDQRITGKRLWSSRLLRLSKLT